MEQKSRIFGFNLTFFPVLIMFVIFFGVLFLLVLLTAAAYGDYTLTGNVILYILITDAFAMIAGVIPFVGFLINIWIYPFLLSDWFISFVGLTPSWLTGVILIIEMVGSVLLCIYVSYKAVIRYRNTQKLIK
jgi:hypothetical protein